MPLLAHSYSTLSRHLDDLTELLLLLPVFLWVANWIAWPLAIPLCIGMLLLYLRHWRQRAAQFASGVTDAGHVHLTTIGLVVCIIISAGITFYNGFDGRITQAYDYMVRNAVYGELITSPWPLILEDGSFVVYAIQYWLPPALLASYLEPYKTPILQGWFFIGLLIIWLQLLKLLGWKKVVVLVICLMLISPLSHPLAHELDKINTFPGAMADSVATYHFYIMGMAMIVLFLRSQTSYPQLLFYSALLFVSAPLTALFFAPIILWRTYQSAREADKHNMWRGAVAGIFRHPELYIALGIVFCALVFNSSSTGATLTTTWSVLIQENAPEVVLYKILLGASLALVSMLLAYAITGEKILIYCGCYAAACVVVCVTGDQRFNELLFKCSTTYCFFLSYSLVKHLDSSITKMYLLLLICHSLPAVWHYTLDVKRVNKAIIHRFAYREENITDPWGSRLSQPGDINYEKLVSHHVNFPWLFQRSGQLPSSPSHPSEKLHQEP